MQQIDLFGDAPPAPPPPAIPAALPAITIGTLPRYQPKPVQSFTFSGITTFHAYGAAPPPDATAREALLLWAARAVTPVGSLENCGPASGAIVVSAWSWDQLQAAIAQVRAAAQPPQPALTTPPALREATAAALFCRWHHQLAADLSHRLARAELPAITAAALDRARTAAATLAEALAEADLLLCGFCHDADLSLTAMDLPT